MTIGENGQGKTEFYQYLERCCQLVSEGYGKPESDTWTNGDYVRLSRILFRRTNVQISPNTLKRIFGKIRTDARYFPQKATRDALAVYIGYSNWEHFVQNQPAEEPSTGEKWLEEPNVHPTAITINKPPLLVIPAPRLRWRWLVLIAVGLTAITLLLQRRFSNLTGQATAQLICLNPVGDNPHSAKFELRGISEKEEHAAGYILDFGDGKRQAVKARAGRCNHYYEQPGRYFAVLRQGERPLDTATIYLPTKGWTATANMRHDTSRVYPIEAPDLFTGGRQNIGLPELARAGIDTNRTFFVEFVNTYASGIDGDNFELTTRVITSPMRPGVRCSQAGVTIFGESSKHSFDVMKPGCVYWTHIQLSEQLRQGQQEDLSFLSADFRTGGVLTLRVVKQQACLWINKRLVYQAHYNKPLRQIYGVNIKFAGTGIVQSFSLRDLKTGKVFRGSF